MVCTITATLPVSFVLRLGLLKDSKMFRNILTNIGKVLTELGSNF